MNGVLLKPLPVRDPGEVVAVFTSDYSGPPYGGSSYPDYLDFREKSDAFAGLSAYTLQPVGILGQEGHPARLWAELITGNYFATLGIPISRGRALGPEDDRPEAAAAVLSHDLLSVAALLVLTALAASYLPARRALRVDPMAALRHE